MLGIVRFCQSSRFLRCTVFPGHHILQNVETVVHKVSTERMDPA